MSSTFQGPERYITNAEEEKESQFLGFECAESATLREIYAAADKDFGAADLQKFTEIDDRVPAAQVLKEMDRILAEELAKKNRRKRA